MSKHKQHSPNSGKAPETQKRAPTVKTDQAQIAHLAYLYWLDRGCPIGSPEEDWSRAEQDLKQGRSAVA